MKKLSARAHRRQYGVYEPEYHLGVGSVLTPEGVVPMNREDRRRLKKAGAVPIKGGDRDTDIG